MNDYEQECAIACSLQYTNTEDIDVFEHSCKKTMIVIESSDTWRNWYRSNDIRTTKNGAHRGFWKYAEWCVEHYQLRDVFRDRHELIITGHSVGAAAAIMITYMLRIYNINVHLVLFGCPRVGTLTFRKHFLKMTRVKCSSFQNTGDLVPCMPIRSFVHIHKMKVIHTNMSIKCTKKNKLDCPCLRIRSARVYAR